MTLLLALAPAAGAQVLPYGTNDYGGFRNVLPPGTSGLVNALQLTAFKATGQRPPHNDDQRQMYDALTTASPGITEGQIPNYFKDATFGVPAGDVASMESPEPGATIVRDKAYGVPHIYGDTRAELMFAIGYATGEDRLFFIDVLRHAGQGDLAAFAGGANVGMDEQVWSGEPYTQQDLANQVQWGRTHSPYGEQIYEDAANYVAGINAYIAHAENPLYAGTALPSEYAALGTLPQPFTAEDLVSIASLVGGIFGGGGGGQLSNAVLYEQLEHRFGPERHVLAGSPERVAVKRKHKKRKTKPKRHHPRALPATARRHRAARHHHRRHHHRRHRRRTVIDGAGYSTLLSFVDPSDPEAPTTVRGHRFPYQTLPRPSRQVRRTLALPDPGSVQWTNHVAAGALPSAADAPRTVLGHGLLGFPRGMSNALLVSAAHSVSGHPLVVMGPQVSYFAPQILMEEDIHGPGIDADGAAFAGVNMYVELGHGTDYAWSATSSGQNIVDTFAVPLCNPAGGAVSLQSDHYELNGQCVPMETLTRSESWSRSLADSTPPGSVTLETQRTAYGLVVARATVHGQPIAYTNLRSTYMHELDSAVGFALFNTPDQMRNPQQFMDAANQIGYTFNWFYADDQHIAYFNSGQNPVRAPHTDPLFPSWSRYAWPGLQPAPLMTPGSLTEQDTPERAHPQAIDQPTLTSWNNKQAPGYNDTATNQEFSSIYRSTLLDQNLSHYFDSGQKLTLADVINAMGNAGTQDLRGVTVLPYALKILGHPSDPQLAAAVDELQNWVAGGAHRINRAHPGASGSYDQSDAVRIMDAWWPLLVRSEFQPVLGSTLLQSVESDFPINDEPGHGTSGEHLGSAWDVGFYGIVQKDLRAVLGQHVNGPLNRIYCGAGSLSACRAALEASLSQAIAEPAAQVYPADSVCAAGDQMCSDSVQFRPIGAVSQPLIEWVNRPTFQQADEIQGHGPR